MSFILRKKLINCFNKHMLFNFNSIGKRFLFSGEILGIDKYVEMRHRVNNQFGDMRGKFFDRMRQYVSTNDMIFTEDLKNIVFLVDNNDMELQLLVDMIKRYYNHNETLRFGTFVFGPIVMRAIHHFNLTDMALTLFRDKQLNGFFSQITTLTILLDLLFERQMYSEVLDVFNYAKENLFLENKYSRDAMLLFFAASYKLNTEESFNEAFNLLKNARQAGALITRKSISFFSLFAINQRHPNIALEVLSIVPQTNYITIRNIRLMGLSDLKRFDDVFTILKVYLNRDVPPEAGIANGILQETIDKIKTSIESIDDKEVLQRFSQIEKALKDGNHIQNTSLDSIITSPVKPLQLDKKRFVNRNQRSFSNRSNEMSTAYNE